MMTIRSFAFAAGLAVTACTAAPVSPDRPAPLREPCGATALVPLIGQPVTSLPASGLPMAVRIIRPGDAVTEDYSEDRLNIELDDRDRIVEVACY